MAIKITENGVVNYENSPDVNRKLFPNLNICGKEIDELAEEINGKAPAVISTSSGSVASFTVGADDMPLKSCVVSIEPIQEGSGDPSPENVRPIAGRTGLSVVRTGKNLLDPSLFIDRSTWNIIAVKVKPDTVYTMSTNKPPNSLYLYFNNINAAGGGSGNLVNNTHAVTIKSTSDGYVYASQRQSSEEDSFQNYNYQIEEGSTVTEYETYKGNSYSVNWETEAGTVYGGTFDVVSGELVVDRAKIVFDGTQTIGNASWRDLEDSSAWLYSPEITPGIENIQGGSGVVSDKLPSIPYNSLYGGTVGISLLGTSYAIGMRVPVSGLTTSALINAWLAENPITVVYKLAEPTEIQLTPQEIRTLLGVNNIWSDGGDVSVEYPADTKLYIDALGIKTVEVSGQTQTITAEENTRYICGEVTSLTFTPCETGICDVRFTAASISTVLTLPQTLKLPDWFDPTLLEAGTTYEINVVDGIYGVVMSWA